MARPFLIIDIDRRATESLRQIVESAGYEARAAYDKEEVVRIDIGAGFCAIFADPLFGEIEGARLFDYLAVKAPKTPVVALLHENYEKIDAGTLKEREVDAVLTKPYDEAEARSVLATLEPAATARATPSSFYGMTGDSEPIRSLFASLSSIADTDTSVLIEGETGSGKELVARAIHKMSRRRLNRFVTVNCGALTESLLETELFGHEKGAFTGAIKTREGKFEYASSGTIFLDEIGEVSPNVQVKLLKVIETGEVERVGANRVIKTDARMIFATNRNLAEDVAAGRFRKDLFYRINVVPIQTPSLRDRPEDIPALARHFLSRYAVRHNRPILRIDPGAMKKLIAYGWPGNVRELEKTMERAVITNRSGVIKSDDLSLAESFGAPDGELPDFTSSSYKEMRKIVMKPAERRYFSALLNVSGGNVSEAALRAGLDRKTFYGKMAACGINPSLFRKKRDDK